MIIVYKRGNYEITRIENVTAILLGDLENLKELHEKEIKAVNEIRRDLSGKNEILGDLTFDILRGLVKTYTQDRLFLNEGYKYVLSVETSSGGSYSFYLKRIRDMDDLIEKIKNREPINYILIDAEEGIIEME
ncbi:MAG: hypothetical protein BXU00_02430 [Candidatus Nanoclepta minutus]|uniref:Uncharacterized protein n=1 Tax=Candidatus Nanoclepta minutus TaxID=1940235 RepID=A0A397WR68_9ARCH|nr:MAG: hypothetical protein BXU00_02430 [Candidatus Nanoclepta minutus]